MEVVAMVGEVNITLMASTRLGPSQLIWEEVWTRDISSIQGQHLDLSKVAVPLEG